MSDAHTERLAEIQLELADLLEDRLTALDGVATGTEGLVMQILSAGLELERHGTAIDEGSILRLRELHDEVKEIVALRVAELNEVLKQSDGAARKLLATELAIDRHRSIAEELSGQHLEIDAQMELSKKEADEVRKELATARAERDRGRDELQEIRRELEQTREEFHAMESSFEELEEEHDALEKEIEAVKIKKRTLEENLKQMRQLHEELMHSMAGIRSDMEHVARGGNDE